jgi:hypothetical protein
MKDSLGLMLGLIAIVVAVVFQGINNDKANKEIIKELKELNQNIKGLQNVQNQG